MKLAFFVAGGILSFGKTLAASIRKFGTIVKFTSIYQAALVDELNVTKSHDVWVPMQGHHAMKTTLYLIAMFLLAGNLGCAMCSHPYDYTYAAYDDAQLSGQRAGSAWAPHSSTSHTVMSEGTPVEAEYSEEFSEGEVMYYDSETP